MIKMFEMLDGRERRILGFLCVLLVALLCFLLLSSIPQRRNYFQTLSSLDIKRGNYQQALKTSIEKKEEWQIWQSTLRDMEEFRKEYFYDGNEGFQPLRLDLQKIFKDTGINVSRLKYDYAEARSGKIKKVNISFDLKGSYVFLKKFIHLVEVFPKFLLIEKIDFLDIDTARGELELKVVLAAYYET